MRGMHFQHGELGSRSLRKSSTDVTMILFLYSNPLLLPTGDLKKFFSINTGEANNTELWKMTHWIKTQNHLKKKKKRKLRVSDMETHWFMSEQLRLIPTYFLNRKSITEVAEEQFSFKLMLHWSSANSNTGIWLKALRTFHRCLFLTT